MFSTFPAGWPGVGLLLLRATLAISAFAILQRAGPSEAGLWIHIAAYVLVAAAALLVAGLFTPVAAALFVLYIAAHLLFGFDALGAKLYEPKDYAILALAAAIAIVFVGPGAFSVDARWFGRRKIVIPRASARPKS